MLSPGVPPTRPVAAQGSTLAGPEKTAAPLVTPTRYYPTTSPLCYLSSLCSAGQSWADNTARCCAFVPHSERPSAAEPSAVLAERLCRTCKMHQYLTATRVCILRGLHCANVTLCLIRHLHHPTRPNFQTPMQSKLPFFRRIRYGHSCQFAGCYIRLRLSPDWPKQPLRSAR